MKKIILISLFILMGTLLASSDFIFAKIEVDTDKDGLFDYEEENIYFTNKNSIDTDKDGFPDSMEVYHGYSPIKNNHSRLTKVILDVPYVHESPDHSWIGPWKNGCEESSIVMVDKYYLGQKEVEVKEAMDIMMSLFNIQDELWGSNSDADAYRIDILINDYTKYNSVIKDNPTINEIKNEINQKRPVIALNYGKVLNNPNIPFLATGSYYHMFVIVGYDDEAQEFIVHDNGDTKTGANHRYTYEVLMESLHDFDFKTRKADGPPRVIFTYPGLVKLNESPKVYLLKHSIKQWVVSEEIFNVRGFNWLGINLARSSWLDKFDLQEDINFEF